MNFHRPLRVVLATVGSRGDVQPMLAVAQALVAQGHIPVIAAPPNFAGWIEGLGFEFAELGVDVQAMLAGNPGLMTGNPLRMLREIVHYFREQPALQVRQLQVICQGADALISAGLAIFVAPSVRERLQLPGFGVLYTTCLLPSNQHPPPTIPWHGLPKWLNDLLWRMDRPFGNWLMRGTLNKMRRLLQLEPVTDIWTHLIDTQPPVLAVDEVLLPPDDRWQGRYPYANFLYFDDPSALDPELDSWLADGDPPIFVGFGSMSGSGTDRISNLIIEAVRATGLRCIVGAGWAGLGDGVFPASWRVVRDAPHALLFPRTAVVVHHGGSGTTAQALRSGVPQVILPLILDQFHHAHRMYVAGLAPRPVPMEKITATELTQAIHAALALPSSYRQIAAERLQASNGKEQVVLRLEEILAGGCMAPHLPPDYALHETTYRRLRACDALGWDAQAEGYTEMLGRVVPALPALVDGKQRHVLELGCGAGNLSVMLAQRGYAITGVDIAPTAIAWATERAQTNVVTAQFRVDNVLELATCDDDAFDAVIDGHCLHCIIGGDRARCLATVLRVLKHGGVFVVLTICGYVTNPHMLETYDAASRTTVHQGRQTRYIGDADSIVAEVAAAGFDIRKVQVVSRKDCDDLDDLVVYAVKSDSYAA